MEIEKIKKFEKVINDNKYSMFQIMVLYNMSCHDNYTKLNDEEKEKILGFLYTLYMKDESKTDLGVFSDIAMENYKKVLNGEIDKNNIYYYV